MRRRTTTPHPPGWFDGPPPSLGWWPASASSPPRKDLLRWWDGKRWSAPASVDRAYTDQQLNMLARTSASIYNCRNIRWHKRPSYWPARCRT